jgi:hypothetical protein
MGLSNVMWGYVAAKGRFDVRDRIDSTYNAKAIERIKKFARVIDTIPQPMIAKYFLGDLETGSYLRGIILETDLDNRYGMAKILEKFDGNGTLVVPCLKHLNRRGPSCEGEMHLLQEITKNTISVVVLNQPVLANFMQLGPKKLSKYEMSTLARSGLDSWFFLRQRLAGLKYATAIKNLETDFKSQATGFQYLAYQGGELIPKPISTLQ